MIQRKAKIGLIGCGFISEIYLKNLTQVLTNTEVVAVTDIVPENAAKRAAQFNIARVCKSNEELLAIKDIDIVLNLTIPTQHAPLCRAALLAGKHVYTEKPLAMTLAEGAELVRLAAEKNLLLACAPDTFMGSGVQTCRRLIDEGWIGRPFAAMCHMLRQGPESWHPDPGFLYLKGAGPIYDTGPYFVTALAYLLGPVKSVFCVGKTPWHERIITSQPRYGQRIPVEVPTYMAALLDFEKDAVASLVISPDVPNSRQMDPRQHNHAIEIFGTEGTLSCPSPCYYDGQIYFKKLGMSEWAELPNLFAYQEDSRGVGVGDLAAAILNHRPPRVTAEMAYHAFEVLVGLDRSQEEGVPVAIESTMHPSAPFPVGLRLGDVDA